MTIDRARLVETIQHFRLIDDTYFNVFMEDNYDDMGLFLRIILSDPTIKLVSIQTQREVSNIFGRSVRFDVFTQNDDGTLSNTEIQRSDDWATPERARFNSCMLDTLTIQKGFDWGKDHLPPTNIIFITEHDVMHSGLPLYHIRRKIEEMNNKTFDDNAQIIYVNASYQDDSDLGRLMHDMFCENPDDMYYKQLANHSRYLKTDEHGVTKMCDAMEKLMNEGRKEWQNEGRIEAEKSTILRLFKGGAKLSMMSMATGWSLEQVESFLHSQNMEPVS